MTGVCFSLVERYYLFRFGRVVSTARVYLLFVAKATKGNKEPNVCGKALFPRAVHPCRLLCIGVSHL